MSAATATLSRMSKKKPKGPDGQGRKPAYTVYARISPELGEALEAYLDSQRPRPTNAATVEVAIEDFLASKGFWPGAAEKAD